ALGFARPEGLGILLTTAGAGMLVGSLVMTAWGGPRRRLAGLLGFELASALAFVLMGLRPNLVLVAAAAFCAHFTLAFVSSLNDAIWQGQAPAEVQGRVFAARQMITRGVTLVAYLLAGGLADRWIEPLLRPGGALAGSLGALIGVGPGRGIALVCVAIGLVKAAAALGLSGSALAREVGEQVDPAFQAHGL
ncbi:MAG: MFS transporter, partial [Anaerolineaceae bacterium]|nr:MFS transporter [Anaerolineaceae bacterium]